jgi:hypothetical protein
VVIQVLEIILLCYGIECFLTVLVEKCMDGVFSYLAFSGKYPLKNAVLPMLGSVLLFPAVSYSSNSSLVMADVLYPQVRVASGEWRVANGERVGVVR